MAHKRPRKAFEADLQAQESPFVTYGTPLPPLDSDARDDGSYVPIWKQEVTDERGRKRLHGAFTGGFSAGYFNTVGSKEGWVPSTFVSSRSNRRKDDPKFTHRRPEDYMDDEDLAEAADAQSLQTSQAFAGLGGTADDSKRKGLLMDLLKIEGDTMGVKLLRRMGWRDGQGIGPKQRRKALLDDNQISGITATNHDQHLFAPPDTQMITFTKKNDRKGLGFEGEARLDQQRTGSNDPYNTKGNDQDDDDDGDDQHMPSSQNGHLESSKRPTPIKKFGFGMGVLNDTGSDEDDPYEMGPKISYNRVIGGDKKKKQQQQQKAKAKPKPPIQTSANPSLGSKPVFRSKKAAALSSNLRKCHDGRLPIDDFVLAETLDASLNIDDEERFPRPRAPEGWVSSKTPTEATDAQDQSTYKSTADAAKQSKLDPKSRAAILGEDQLPGKSVFDYLSPTARDRIASATGRTNLPQALNEATKLSSNKSKPPLPQESASTPTASTAIPHLAKETALAALGRGTAGWTPYASDPDKASRYRNFLEFRGGLRALPPSRPSDLKPDSWQQELSEFAHAAEVFKPMTGLMASRFTSSATAPRSTTGEASDEQDQLLRQPGDGESAAAKDPAEEAARAGMFGPLTRNVRTFYPTRLVCKRFGVRPPEHVVEEQTGASSDNARGSGPSGDSARERTQAAPPDLVGRADMERMMKDSGRQFPIPAPTVSATADDGSKPLDASSAVSREVPEAAVIDAERNEALEADRAGEELFKAIFGDDDDDDNEY